MTFSYSFFLFLRRNGIEASPAKGIATDYPKNGKIETFESSVDADSLDRILGTRRRKPAHAPKKIGMDFPIDSDGKYQSFFHGASEIHRQPIFSKILVAALCKRSEVISPSLSFTKIIAHTGAVIVGAFSKKIGRRIRRQRFR